MLIAGIFLGSVIILVGVSTDVLRGAAVVRLTAVGGGAIVGGAIGASFEVIGLLVSFEITGLLSSLEVIGLLASFEVIGLLVSLAITGVLDNRLPNTGLFAVKIITIVVILR
eukprot:CAMPEP_0196764692 /NCGR_PEP_ID=MMETSP1095-20130614/6651_1 /TAXON_ID=96789 ORGANISM="Chromulina nebulosa, Strain UTEXLB2642" /NCGR_SAMPLE_ID=MMETSP1095 /ASSEMBLY_ACC=CAM_ASM_000446 /LENGTH=111 /DNA_ID=CAMNT_0042120893 /DNA_START=58 /DNA_END=392 /DNA_ORIENTATION=-